MSIVDYEMSKRISLDDPSFAAIIMAAFRKADSDNFERLRRAFPQISEEMHARYHAPGGLLEGEVRDDR